MKSLFDAIFPDDRCLGSGIEGQDPDYCLGSAEAEKRRSAVQVRPSTLLRVERLRELIAALSLRSMKIDELTVLLGCSGSAVRNYLQELIDARIAIGPGRPSAARAERDKKYRLSHDDGLVERYLADLSKRALHGPLAACAVPGGKRKSLADVRYIHCSFRDKFADEGTQLEVTRDPLVAALFGA